MSNSISTFLFEGTLLAHRRSEVKGSPPILCVWGEEERERERERVRE